MKFINYESTLDYYDGVQIFEARDPIGGNYLGVLVESNENSDRFFVFGVVPDRLNEFRIGNLDLIELVNESSTHGRYVADSVGDFGQPMALEEISADIPEAWVPAAGYVLQQFGSSDEVVREAIRRNRVVIELFADPPESVGTHRMRSAVFGNLLIRTQNLLMHAYKRALREINQNVKRDLRTQDGFLVDVVAAPSAGSFKLTMEAASPPDLFGSGEIVRALEVWDSVFEVANHPEDAKVRILDFRGHLAGSYMKLMELLAENETGLRYAWADPIQATWHGGGVSRIAAQRMVNELTGDSSLRQEEVSLEGEFEKVNRGPGEWGLKIGESVRSGKTLEGGPSLNGLEVGSRYQFDCVEESVLIAKTGGERRTLYLLRITKL